MLLNPNMAATAPSPVVEAFKWIDGRDFPPEKPLINVSQAAPVEPPPEPLRQAIADIALNDPAAHLYGPVLGLDPLRARIATEWSRDYGGEITAGQVAITSGCNQAFVAALATLAGPGDEVLLATPWYFNHKMWLDMGQVKTVPLPAGPDLVPDARTARDLITPRTRAIALVSPNNPAGVEYPAGVLHAFYDLAREAGLALVVDETYRDFDSRSGAPHALFTQPDWPDTLIHLYSFSKVYRLTGHRIGAMIASAERLAQVEKFIDTVTICPSQIGQRAALWGMENLARWKAGERAEVLDRRAAIADNMERLPGWHLRGLGAYFAWLEYPFDMPSDRFARHLADDYNILALPGTFFTPEGDPGGLRHLRVAFANIDRAGIGRLFERLAGVAP